ncbi:MAG: beta-N-acetylhexosaminidase [Rhodospirillaceae bacterium]|jgi:beta-N-acetylhexosaminidase|nr:beta-N-acetylhexosaminidase [Rhodospirillaceae bacterium]MBT4046301.1 beta-N-acetylhexosaminidase [Rhodospirillaceae bacterium]MBT4688631.1 beta-N-acetylhexosaminidase [Rhodospirillaceae bacterium]MBT5082324.1 beta-N-acetylhexosaminidase [Rhodospirillaceae bacterium]MBT5523438.1 beta-N-acetylhexosaminidase [Rhodospirillaceae bacterium]
MTATAPLATPLAAVFGCAGPVLGPEEAAFFRDSNPLGFILFARNCESPDQIRRLTHDLRSAVGRETAPVLMDHEGGRVQRLATPQWREVPAAAVFGQWALKDPDAAANAAALNGQLMAMELLELGIDVNCVPCLDVHDPAGNKAIGDRAFSADPDLVTQLGRAQTDGLLRGGVLPVMKHIPGHGRATVDSHLELPVVPVAGEALAERDFRPFAALADLPMGMTAHVLYPSLDPEHPATLSRSIIDTVIRGQIGFDGLLFSDDLSMRALGGSLDQRAAAALAAGCDVALHCNGNGLEMQSIAAVCGPLSEVGQRRWQAAMAYRGQAQAASYEALLAAFTAQLASL